MSDFKAKILHQIVCSPAGGAYSWLDFRGLLRRGGEGTREEGRGGQKRAGRGKGEGRDRVGDRGGEGAGSAPKLKLGPQNYFPGASAVESAYWTSY